MINGFELVKECIIKMCNNINRPISIPIKKAVNNENELKIELSAVKKG